MDSTQPRTTAFTAACCAVTLGVASAVLVGWTFDLAYLKSVAAGLTAMNPLTAVCFVVAGISLWLARDEHASSTRFWFSRGGASLLLCIGLIKIFDYTMGWNLEIDRVLFRESLGDNQMAPNTAICFILVALSVLLIDRLVAGGKWVAQIPMLMLTTLSLFSLIGYAYGAAGMYSIRSFIPMALNTAFLFHVLSLGLLLSRPERGIVSVLLHPGLGGVMARRLLPVVIILPATLGWLRVSGQRLGWYDTEFGAAFMVATTVIIFAVAVCWIAHALNRTDEQRERVTFELERSHQQLETRVASRTTELKISNADLLEKNQENEMFVYSVSHDLRSPLVNLQGFSQELTSVTDQLRDVLSEAKLPEQFASQTTELIDNDMNRCIRFIQTSVTRLSGIIDSLLRLSRAGRVDYSAESVELDPIVTRVIEAMSATIYDRGVSIQANPLPSAWGDSIAIEQIFANLIGNAVNYLDAKRPGKIEIGSYRDNENADTRTVFYVKDNGLGIPASYHGKVFQALKRLHPDVAQGEGIGLALVKRMVERHGGSIWFESTPNVGTTFYFHLPPAPANAFPHSNNFTKQAELNRETKSVRHPVG
jgi:signal transduction histidine kinase